MKREISVNQHERLTKNSESIFRQEEDGAFLFDPESGNLKYINNMGVTIYELCDGGLTVGEITAMVAENYKDVSSEKIENDIHTFLKALLEMEFLKREVISDEK